jgi:hypothetical protein
VTPMAKKAKKTFSATVIKPSTIGDEGTPTGVHLDNFFSVMNMTGRKYMFAPCREFWPASSVNARIPPVVLRDANGQPLVDSDGKVIKLAANKWLDKFRPVEAVTWAPGLPLQIQDRLVSKAGWIDRQGVSCFNQYRSPRIKLGDASKAGPWLDHIHRIYPDDALHIIKWNAQRVQFPGVKINHALVLGGAQGIGKDTLLHPVRYAVGPYNFLETSPVRMLGRFNPFAEAVILRVNEARDLGEVNRFDFYDHIKDYCAAPPPTLPVEDKYIPQYYVLNVVGVVITTNHKTDGIYLPNDDRRHYVAWSNCVKEDFTEDYWKKLWGFYENENGCEHVAAYLTKYDLSTFNPNAHPPQTPAWHEIVSVNRAPEDAELADLIDKLGDPDTLTLAQLTAAAEGETVEYLMNRKNWRAIPHRLESCHYVSVPNKDAKDKLWKCDGKRQVIYARDNLSPEERLAAAKNRARS